MGEGPEGRGRHAMSDDFRSGGFGAAVNVLLTLALASPRHAAAPRQPGSSMGSALLVSKEWRPANDPQRGRRRNQPFGTSPMGAAARPAAAASSAPSILGRDRRRVPWLDAFSSMGGMGHAMGGILTFLIIAC